MKMTKKEREGFRRILKDCQDMNGDDAFDRLANFICDNLEDEEVVVKLPIKLIYLG